MDAIIILFLRMFLYASTYIDTGFGISYCRPFTFMPVSSRFIQTMQAFIFVLLGTSLHGQVEVVTLKDQDSIRMIGHQIYLLEDPSASLSFEDILAKDHLFKLSDKKVPNFEVTKSKVWGKIYIKRESDDDFKISFGWPNLDTLRFYYPGPGGYTHKVSGWRYPVRVRDLRSPDLVFDLLSTPHDSIVPYYFSAEGRIVILPVVVAKSKGLFEEVHINELYYLFYLGFITMLFFYNFSIYITSGEKEYLYYSTWVFFATIFFMIAKGYSSLYIPEFLNPVLRHTNIISSFGGISIVLFVMVTLRLKEYWPAILKWFYGTFVLYGVIIIGSLMGQLQFASNLSQLALLITVVLGLIAGAKMYLRGHSFAKYYFFGFIITLISMFIYILIFQNVFEYNAFTNNSILVGSAIEMILFSFGLGAKIQTIHKEKISAQALAISALSEKEQFVSQQNVILESRVEERTHELKQEKIKSDELLLNILPSEVASELMKDGYSEARNYSNVSVLFTDFVNFTGISEQISPKDLIKELHICFTGIDEIIERYKMEKIKTIGDAYLAVCGLPNPCNTHALNTIRAAIDILEFTHRRKSEGGLFDIRIGVHSGPVIAGIVGIKKFAFDIWGDTVNTAARMEQNSVPGKINISGETYNLIKDQVTCTYRGKIDAKNKGSIDMYFVSAD